MAFKLQWEIATDDWRDATAEMLVGEFWKERPDDELGSFMEEWELDAHTAVLYKLIAGEEVSSRRGGRFRLVIEA